MERRSSGPTRLSICGTGVPKFHQAVIGANCYIERTPPYRMAGLRFERGHIPLRFFPDRFDQPLRWAKPRRIFVNALSDTFHEDVPFETIERLWKVMWRAEWHTFMVLTKRPERMSEFLRWLRSRPESAPNPPPLPNVWLGVTVENQRWADERIPILLDTPAAVRFVSCEPLLSGINLREWLGGGSNNGDASQVAGASRLDWVICGGESAGSPARALVERCPSETLRHEIEPEGCALCGGKGWRPKPAALEWVRSLVLQCRQAGVPFFWKGWGGPRPTSGGYLIDGRVHREARRFAG